MTTQEFVKQEVEAASNQMFPIGNEHESKMIASQEYRNGMAYGLTKGLEIAADVLDFAVNKYFSVERLDGKTYWAKSGETGNIQYLTTSELITIFLTEKYGNNG